ANQEYRDLTLRNKGHQRSEQNSQCNTKSSHNNYLIVTAFFGTSLPFTTWSFAIFEASTLTLSEALPKTLITGSAGTSLVDNCLMSTSLALYMVRAAPFCVSTFTFLVFMPLASMIVIPFSASSTAFSSCTFSSFISGRP